jgi:hypothetical protein
VAIGLKVPILLNANGSLYKVAYLNFRKDSSVYIYFPRKQGYVISREAKAITLNPGIQQITLGEARENAGTPYISYHPGKHTVHVNLQPEGRYSEDVSVVEMAEDLSQTCFPLCQIMIADLDYFDTVKKNKHEHPLIINRHTDSPDGLLIEVWLHSKEAHINLGDLPLIKERLKAQDIVGFLKLSDSRLANITASVLITTGQIDRNENDYPRHLVAIWQRGGPLFFEMKPKNI